MRPQDWTQMREGGRRSPLGQRPCGRSGHRGVLEMPRRCLPSLPRRRSQSGGRLAAHSSPQLQNKSRRPWASSRLAAGARTLLTVGLRLPFLLQSPSTTTTTSCEEGRAFPFPVGWYWCKTRQELVTREIKIQTLENTTSIIQVLLLYSTDMKLFQTVNSKQK